MPEEIMTTENQNVKEAPADVKSLEETIKTLTTERDTLQAQLQQVVKKYNKLFRLYGDTLNAWLED